MTKFDLQLEPQLTAMRASLAMKLHPERIQYDPKLAAVVGCFLEEEWGASFKTVGIVDDVLIGLVQNPDNPKQVAIVRVARIDCLLDAIRNLAERAELGVNEIEFLLSLPSVCCWTSLHDGFKELETCSD